MYNPNNRDYKKYFVLNLINHFNSISRTKLADITDYRSATISEIIKELLEDRIIIEKGSVYAGQGRRRTLLEFNDDYLCGIGVAIYPPNIELCVSSFKGKLLDKIICSIQDDWSVQQIIDAVVLNTCELISRCDGKNILGIGICDPGIVVANQEYSISSVFIKEWQNIRLRSIVEKVTKLPVVVASRAHLLAVAEQKIGLAQGQSDFMCVTLSKGIGLSFVSNGKVVNGHTAMAGQIGHIYVHDNDKPCYCGNHGCVECSTALPAIRSQITAALDAGAASIIKFSIDKSRELTVEDIRNAIDHNDRLCINIVKRAARLIGAAIANTANILNPQSVIMSGEMVNLGDVFLSTIEESARERIVPMFNASVEFKVSYLPEFALSLTAVSRIFSDFLQSDHYPESYSFNKDECNEN